jgi:transposase
VCRTYNACVLDANALPNDVEVLKGLLLEREATLASRELTIREKDRHIEHLKLQLARLRRWKFGQASEALESAGQITLSLEEIAAAVSQALNPTGDATPAAPRQEKGKPIRRKQFPEHFERIDNRIEPGMCACPECGGAMSELGYPDVAEVIETKTVTFTVKRHIRPKMRCCKCSTVVQAPAPSRPLERSFAGASFLALILVWKYGFHVPLYRQCQIFAHSGLKLSRTTLMQWVAGSAALLGPLVEALARYVLAGKINADDTPVKVLAPGTGKTKRGYLWTYVRDGRPWKSPDPPAAWYRYSPDRKGQHPQQHLKSYRGKLQVDAYAGFEALFVPAGPGRPANIVEIACWAHVRRGLFDLYEANRSPTAQEALDRIGKLYEVEAAIRGQSAPLRLAARQQYTVPLLHELHHWMLGIRTKVENKSELAKALDYALNRWRQLSHFTEDGTLEIDNNIAERSVRGVGIGKKNFMFFGSDSGGERAAIAYSLIETCKLNHIDPQRYLEYVLARIADHPINRVEELLPWNVADKLGQPDQVSQTMAA